MRNAVFKIVGNVLISLYNEHPTTDADTTEGLAQLKKMDMDTGRALIITRGGAPTAAQRKMVYDAMNGRELTAAFVSSSVVVRGVVTAMSWFNRRNKVFAPSELAAALRYLDIPSEQEDFFRSEIASLEVELERLRSKSVAGGK